MDDAEKRGTGRVGHIIDYASCIVPKYLSVGGCIRYIRYMLGTPYLLFIIY